MSIANYFNMVPKDAPLPISWKPSAEPTTNEANEEKSWTTKKIWLWQLLTVMITDSDREKKNEPNSSTTSTGEVEGKNSPSMKRLYGTKWKKTVIAYAI